METDIYELVDGVNIFDETNKTETYEYIDEDDDVGETNEGKSNSNDDGDNEVREVKMLRITRTNDITDYMKYVNELLFLHINSKDILSVFKKMYKNGCEYKILITF